MGAAPAEIEDEKRRLAAPGFAALQQSLKPGQQAILIATNGAYSFKGSGYVRGGLFDRFEILQGDNSIRFRRRAVAYRSPGWTRGRHRDR